MQIYLNVFTESSDTAASVCSQDSVVSLNVQAKALFNWLQVTINSLSMATVPQNHAHTGTAPSSEQSCV